MVILAGYGSASAVLSSTAAAHASQVPLILLIIGAAMTWVIGLLLWPYGRCVRCKGTGRNIGSSGRRWGNCRRCKGTGRRVRFGARLAHRVILRREVK